MAHEQLPIFTFRWGANFGKIYSASQILPVLSALCHVQRWHGSMLCSLHQDTMKRAHTCLHDQHSVSWHSCSCNTHRAIPHSIIFHLPFQIMHLCPINSQYLSSGACGLWYIILVPVEHVLSNISSCTVHSFV